MMEVPHLCRSTKKRKNNMIHYFYEMRYIYIYIWDHSMIYAHFRVSKTSCMLAVVGIWWGL